MQFSINRSQRSCNHFISPPISPMRFSTMKAAWDRFCVALWRTNAVIGRTQLVDGWTSGRFATFIVNHSIRYYPRSRHWPSNRRHEIAADFLENFPTDRSFVAPLWLKTNACHILEGGMQDTPRDGR